MRNYLIGDLLRDAGIERRAEEVRYLVFEHIIVIIDYRVLLDFGVLVEPCLDFVPAHQVGVAESWSDIEARHYSARDHLTPIFQIAPGR